MRSVECIVIGKGTVGSAFLRIHETRRAVLAARGLDLRLRAVAGRSQLRDCETSQLIEHKGWADLTRLIADLSPHPPVVVDLTAEENGEVHADWLERGWSVVTANKKPLSSTLGIYDRIAAHSDRYWHEATVGAGLPVIGTLRDLLDSGDEIFGIRAALSGTMGFIFSACQAGMKFEQAVAEAKARGYTEPDPRDDLRGTDIARKALILGRMIGLRIERSDLAVEDLVPTADIMDKCALRAASEGKALRYLAGVTPAGISVGVEAVGPDDPFFALKGPENLFVIRTKRYDAAPLMIRGPGAGAEVTAAAVFTDVLRAARTQ